MTELLLDSGAWVASVDPDHPHRDGALALIRGAAIGEVTIAGLDLSLYEVANVAIRQWRSPADARRLVELVRITCGDALERVDATLLEEAIDVAQEHGLNVYDAAYVAAATRRGARLVSTDLADLVRPGLAISPEQAAGA